MENRDKAYHRALEEAKKEFVKRDPHIMARASGSHYREAESSIRVPLMQKNYSISYPSGQVEAEDNKEVSLPYQILLLHYLLMGRGLPLKNRWISFKEIPGGLIYYDAFYRRTIEPLMKCFGERANDFRRIGEMLDGEELDLGDVAFAIKILPRIPVAYILWEKDPEHPSRASVLFDDSAKQLPMEDLALLASIPIWSMLGMAKRISS